ncbi:ABC transporter-like protein, partial [Dinothrombium tinctorium]
MRTKEDLYLILWNNLSYTIKISALERLIAYVSGLGWIPKTKEVVKNLNGYFKQGELVAFMGPSGAGKSTLLESIAGIRVTGRDGTITSSSKKELSLVFIPQHDHFLSVL